MPKTTWVNLDIEEELNKLVDEEESLPPVDENAVICNCGRVLRENDNFCGNCGEKRENLTDKYPVRFTTSIYDSHEEDDELIEFVEDLGIDLDTEEAHNIFECSYHKLTYEITKKGKAPELVEVDGKHVVSRENMNAMKETINNSQTTIQVLNFALSSVIDTLVDGNQEKAQKLYNELLKEAHKKIQNEEE